MEQRTQVWTACMWIAVIVQSIQALRMQYPELNVLETVKCECKTCQAVLWYWQPLQIPAKFQFLFYHNNADKVVYEPSVNQTKYKGGKQEGGRTITYSLKISAVQKSDAGLYFCLVHYHNNRNEPSDPGVQLRPGVKPPTPSPPPPPKTPSACRCRNRGIKKYLQGCGRLVLWPLVGLLVSLVVVLIATLYYFSRLPKKCRHRFVKKKQLQ
ncbi:hypothetical protein AAFF_G00378660 [Aldrovandia affinis]|uniref:Immunoglobulin V-set domain-containing protein n=1 Tax=Aldrovandia affinis TaxID=143900 RepID=A0AAD7WMJ9_9TELE|nr:hypothetical protein AAFF_G00378660 [Aldrovandia affinis]